MLVPVDIVMDIEFPMAPGTKPVIRTNAKREALEELLTTWLHWKATSSEKDTRDVTERDVHHIKIGLALANDEFCTEHDVGNNDAAIGMVLETLQRLDEVEVLPLH